MKSNIVQITSCHVRDNRENIEGNVAEHLWREANTGNESEFFWYLSEETIEAIHGKPELWHNKGEELKKWLYDHYDFDISEMTSE